MPGYSTRVRPYLRGLHPRLTRIDGIVSLASSDPNVCQLGYADFDLAEVLVRIGVIRDVPDDVLSGNFARDCSDRPKHSLSDCCRVAAGTHLQRKITFIRRRFEISGNVFVETLQRIDDSAAC